MPSAGGLFELERNGTRVPAIAHVGKSAYFYVLDRATGEPLLDVRETPVPQGRRADRVVLADAADSRSPAAARARQLQRRRCRQARRHDARARRGVPRLHGAQRRLLQRGAVHAVHVQGARRTAEVDDPIPRRDGRRQLGRRRHRSRRAVSSSRRRTTARSSAGCKTRIRTSPTASRPAAPSSRTIARASTASARSSRSARR